MEAATSTRPVWLTTIEAADYLRLTPGTLADKRTAGNGQRYYKVGPGKRARVLYWQEDLDNWVVG